MLIAEISNDSMVWSPIQFGHPNFCNGMQHFNKKFWNLEVKKFNSTVAAELKIDDVLVLQFYFIF
jgi:hypothetical protein